MSKLSKYKQYLISCEKSEATIEKYIRDAGCFLKWTKNREITKELVLEYKEIISQKFKPTGANSVISSLNSYFDFAQMTHCKVKSLKIQKRIFMSQDRELSKAEYTRLLKAAEKNKRLYFVMQTICACGIRVSELKYITVEAIKTGQASINCKGKMRIVMLPNQLCKKLRAYAGSKGIKSGAVFITRNGNPLDRSNIWSDMKKLCTKANVSEEKVFPHNLRHLFARVYYSMKKDIVRLADILGHSSINTTRIYTMESGDIHRKHIEKLGLLLC